MFADLFRRLTAPDPGHLPDAEARVALTALLVRIARADSTYTAEERRRIERVVATRFDLAPVAAADLRAEGESAEAEAPDTVRFTRAIKDHVPYEERQGVIETLWELVLADGRRDEEENALMRTVAPLLGVSDRDSGLARQRVASRRE